MKLINTFLFIEDKKKDWLRIVYKDYKSSFAELLSDKSFTVHHKNVQKLAIEIY